MPPIETLLLNTTLLFEVNPPTVVSVLEKTVFVPVVEMVSDVFAKASPMLTAPVNVGAVDPVLTVKL